MEEKGHTIQELSFGDTSVGDGKKLTLHYFFIDIILSKQVFYMKLCVCIRFEIFLTFCFSYADDKIARFTISFLALSVPSKKKSFRLHNPNGLPLFLSLLVLYLFELQVESCLYLL